MQLQAEDKLILSCIKINPSIEELEQINSLIPLIKDWDYLISTIIERGIGPLMYKKLPHLGNRSLMPETVTTKLQQVYYKTFSRSTILYEHFRKIAEAFVFHNISVIALKGIYLSEWLYQDIGLRQFSDIDLLVKEDDGEKCLSILEDMGYKQFEFKVSELVRKNTEFGHYPAMILNGVSVEIHIELNRKIEKYDLIIHKLWSNAILATINNVQIYVLNIYDLLIHLCLHLDKHFRGGHVQFTCFNDITNLLDKHSGTMDWIVFTETCQLYKCEEIVYKYIVLVHKYMNAKVPEDIIQKSFFLLTEKDEQLFINYLKGDISSVIALSNHLENIKNTKSFLGSAKYLSNVLFPSKVFMIQLYNIKHPYLFIFYYPYRHFIAIKGILQLKSRLF